jgi:HlyD family secretion protein
MTANVTFVYAQKDDVLRVPNAALRFRPPPEMLAAQPGNADARPAAQPPDRRTVWVLRGGQPVAVRIRAGISDGSTTEVLEGELAPGDEVVTDATGGSRGIPAAMRRGL